jgi:phage terminase large subunit-like protein
LRTLRAADPSSSERYAYDETAARQVTFFIEEYCRHVKGPLKGQPFHLAAWQRRLVCNLFGWRRADGTRRFRHLWLEAPRKSGKTSFAAALGLYMLFVDPEPGAEIAVAAADAQQAQILFDIARQMIAQDPDLSSMCRVYRNRIQYKDAQLHIVSARAEQKHGGNVSCLIFDEVHLQSSRHLHDALITSMAARTDPLVLYLTTAGWDTASFAWEHHRYAQRIRDGVHTDPSWLVSIFAAEPNADWTDPKVWQRTHPGLGVSVSEDFLRQECLRAQQTPGFVRSFRRLYLNIWTEKASAWLSMPKWDACGQTPVSPEDLVGRRCYAGLDLSSTTDLTALVLVFADDDGGATVLPFAFCPEEALIERTRRDGVDYLTWHEHGALIATPGNVVDHNAILGLIRSLSERYRIEEIGYDRWNASMLINQLTEDGFACVPIPQTAGIMNAPARALEALVAQGRLRHGGHPVLRWCAANTVVEMNAAGDLKPTRGKSNEKIDLIIGLLMALSRQLLRS